MLINLKDDFYDESLIKEILSSEEIDFLEQGPYRVDKDILTNNNVLIHCYCTSHQKKLMVSFYDSIQEKELVRISYDLEVKPNGKKWVYFYDKNNEKKVIFDDTIISNRSIFAKTEDGIYHPVYLVEIQDGTFELSNGHFAIGQYGKYMPNITFISPIPEVIWKSVNKESFNLPEGHLYIIKGTFFISKKGTKCFRVDENGDHVLIKDSWGGAFDRYRGRTLPEESSLYYRRASSNGGGSGNDYIIVPKNWKYQLSEEDL